LELTWKKPQAAHSKLDFVAKLTIQIKEAKETRYWIETFLIGKNLLADMGTDHLKKTHNHLKP